MEDVSSLSPYCMGMHVSHSMDTKVPEKGIVWRLTEIYRRCIGGIGKAKGA
jgi:hypothetical protein